MLYKESGKPAIHLKAGDVIEIASIVELYQGATATSWFSHFATNSSPVTNENILLETVINKDYDLAHQQIQK